MLDSYFSKVILMLVVAGIGFGAVVGGYFTLYQVLTFVGN